MTLFNQRHCKCYYPFDGKGWIGGSLPPDPNPNSPDGRTRVMGEPVQMLVRLLDGKTRLCIDSVLSNPDGTWKFIGLKLNHWFAVEFVNQNGVYTDNTGTPYNSFIQDFIYAIQTDTALSRSFIFEGQSLHCTLNIDPLEIYSHFRLLITGSYHDNVVALAEFVLKDHNGNLFIPTSYSASSEYPGGSNQTANAFDGDINTQWASWSESYPKTIECAGSAPFAPAELILSSGPDLTWGPLQALRDFKLQGSTDGIVWDDLLTITDQPTWAASETRTWTL